MRAGTRFGAAGLSCALQRVVLGSTQSRSAIKIARDLEDMGATVSAKSGREVFAVTGESLRDFAPELTEALVESATQLKLWPWEVSEALHDFEGVLESHAGDAVTAVTEGVHAAAFGAASPLGRSLLASADELHEVDAEAVRAFLGQHLVGSNVVLSATNVDHKALVAMAENMLASVPQGAPAASAKAAVVGGESLLRSHGGGAHIALALPAPAQGSAQYHALGVLQGLLGGSGSRGPPGQPRLGYQRQTRISMAAGKAEASGALLRSATAFAFPYSDAGLLGVAGMCSDADAGRFVAAAVGLLKDVAGKPIASAELDRAKRAYKLAYLADVEGRQGARDEAGAALLMGRRLGAAETLKAIDAVTADQVAAVVRTALKGPPSISATGSLSAVPRYDVLANSLL